MFDPHTHTIIHVLSMGNSWFGIARLGATSRINASIIMSVCYIGGYINCSGKLSINQRADQLHLVKDLCWSLLVFAQLLASICSCDWVNCAAWHVHWFLPPYDQRRHDWESGDGLQDHSVLGQSYEAVSFSKSPNQDRISKIIWLPWKAFLRMEIMKSSPRFKRKNCGLHTDPQESLF